MKIKDVCTYAPKSTIKAGDATIDGQYMFFTSSEDESKRYGEYQFDCEGIIMGMGGNATLHYYNGRFAVSTDCVVLLPDDRLRCKYLYYFFLANLSLLEAGFKGAGLKHTNKGYIGNIDIQIPPLEEQDGIVNALDRVFEIKRSRNKELALLDDLIKARFVEMFGDHEYPNVELIDVIKEGAGLSYGIVQPGDDGTGDMGVLRPVDLVDGTISTKSIKYINRSIGDGFRKTELTGDELLITVRGTTGITALTDERFKGMNVTRGIAVIRYDRCMIDPVYLNAYLNTIESQRYISDHTRGATLQQINLSDLRIMRIKIPPMETQKSFAVIAKHIDKSKFVVQKALDEAQLLFDSLMQKYFG